ncbi:MAG: NADH-quinone oxidoreductase subunit E [Paracoccaceae bacterium]|nr:NADH-quinone oxidoreductase subunit E [Paracoccaceae bacterium]
MSLRRLYHTQPESFAFTPANQAWADAQITKYPEGRQASAVIPILWRAQEQEGWVTRPMIEEVARMLDLAQIRVLEVASFYFMFQLQPVGSVAHIQVCGTTSCMICGAEDLVGVCKEKIAPNPHELSPDGKFSWEEVECLGACSNAPMAQIGKDYYEDLTAEKLGELIDAFARGEVPAPGPQTGRWASEPISGLTSLEDARDHDANASVDLARRFGDTIDRIQGEPPAVRRAPPPVAFEAPPVPAPVPEPEETVPAKIEPAPVAELPAEQPTAAPAAEPVEEPAEDGTEPAMLSEARGGQPDDLKQIKGIGPKLEGTLNGLGVYHFDQIANWSDGDVAWVDEKLSFKGRIERERWIPQARGLAGLGPTAAKPPMLSEPRGGRPDDLKRISGVGPKLEGVLNGLGVYHFDQIAAWTEGEIAWVDDQLKFKGRIERDDWIGQASILAANSTEGR